MALASTGLTAPEAPVRMRFDLALRDLAIDGQRVLSMLRARGYRLQRFELEAPAGCHLWVRLRPSQAWLLKARLDRLAGVSVEGGATRLTR